MGRAFFSPLEQPVRRRVAAAAVSVCANALLVALILFLPRPETSAPQPDVIEIVLFTPEPEPEPEPVIEVFEDEPETVETPVEQDAVPEPAAEAAPPPPETIEAAPDQDEEDLRPAGGSPGPIALPEFEGDAIPLPAGRGSTSFVLRELFCLTSSAATREAGHCPDFGSEDPMFFLQHASPENLARAQAAFDLSSDEIRALFAERALPALNDLSGQDAISNQHSQATSSADSMRDSLPPQHPDPAFGD